MRIIVTTDAIIYGLQILAMNGIYRQASHVAHSLTDISCDFVVGIFYPGDFTDATIADCCVTCYYCGYCRALELK